MRFPRDVTVEILSWLSLKTLLRFKSVSKQWNIMISDPVLAKLHLQRSKNKTNYPLFPSPHLLLCKQDKELLVLKHERHVVNNCRRKPLYSSIRKLTLKLDVEKTCYPIGSSNGLICYVVGSSCKNFLLCNPATQEQRPISGPPLLFDINLNFGYDSSSRRRSSAYNALRWGFGYDLESDDYKIILLMENLTSDQRKRKHKRILYGLVFTLRTNVWRELDMSRSFPYDHYDDDSMNEPNVVPVLVGNTLNWRLSPHTSEGSWKILAFNLGEENFHMVPLPNQGSDFCTGFFVSQVKQCLCASWLLSTHEHYGNLYIEIWILEHYGDWKSWKIYFKHERLERYMTPSDIYPQLFEFQDNGALMCDKRYGKFLVINPSGGTLFQPGEDQLENVDQVLDYTEGLMSPFSYQ